jgi:hypothetical protein
MLTPSSTLFFYLFIFFFLHRHFHRICDTLKLSLWTGESEYLSGLLWVSQTHTHGPRSPTHIRQRERKDQRDEIVWAFLLCFLRRFLVFF